MCEYDDILGEENKPKCQRCMKEKNVITYHQRTMYEKEEDNWVTLCESCKEENDEYWDEMWKEYYRGCL